MPGVWRRRANFAEGQSFPIHGEYEYSELAGFHTEPKELQGPADGKAGEVRGAESDAGLRRTAEDRYGRSGLGLASPEFVYE